MADSTPKAALADETIKKHMLAAVGVGLVPVPLADLAALAGVQLNLLRSLAGIYGVEFSSQLGKAAIAALAGGGLSVSLSLRLGSLAKGLPVLGWAAAPAGVALFGGASTYAVGKVFVQHFESGNTFLSFDPEAVRAYYARQFEQGKAEVKASFAGIKP